MPQEDSHILEEDWTEEAIKEALEARYGEWGCFDVDEAYDQLESLLDEGQEEPYTPPRLTTTDEGPVHELYDPETDTVLRYIETDSIQLPERVYDGGNKMMAEEEDVQLIK